MGVAEAEAEVEVELEAEAEVESEAEVEGKIEVEVEAETKVEAEADAEVGTLGEEEGGEGQPHATAASAAAADATATNGHPEVRRSAAEAAVPSVVFPGAYHCGPTRAHSNVDAELTTFQGIIVLDAVGVLVPDEIEARVDPAPPQLVYNAARVDDRPWWRRHRGKVALLASISCLFVAASITDVVAVVHGTNGSAGRISPSQDPTNAPTTLTQDLTATVALTPSTTSLSPPINCVSVTPDGALLKADCDNCGVLTAIDGSSAVTTAFGDVRLYDLVDGSWNQTDSKSIETSRWLAPAISGNFAVIGAYDNKTLTGAAYVFERDPDAGGFWRFTAQLVPEGNNATVDSNFGYSVAVDGIVAVVGARGISANVFRRGGADGVWSWEARFTSSADSSRESFGVSVGVRGNTLVVGEFSLVHVYDYNPLTSTWNKFRENIHGFFNLGVSVDVMENGELVVGYSQLDFWKGAVYHYVRSGDGGPYVQRQQITASDRTSGDVFGSWAQISVHKNVMAVGAYGAQLGQGQVYLYHRSSPSNNWVEVTKIPAPFGAAQFGLTLSLSASRLIVGSKHNAYTFLLRLKGC